LINGKKRGRRLRYSLIGVAIVIFILIPFVIESPYTMHLFIMAFVAAMLGMTFSMLFSSGQISLGGAAPFAIGAYASALLTLDFKISFWLALPAATVITGILALGIGWVLCRHAGAAFVVLTMVFGLIVVQTAGQVEQFGGWGGLTSIPRPDAIANFQFVGKTPYYYLILFLLLLVMLLFYALYTSRFGRIFEAIKLSPHLAQSLGINLFRYRLMAFVVASIVAGAVGSFYAHYARNILPDTFGAWSSIRIQLYPVLGGLDYYILGPAVGAIIMTFVPEYLRIAKEVEPVITGMLLLLIIVFFPGGILGVVVKSRPTVNLPVLIKRIRSWQTKKMAG
jgi:branched-chain amino acid transport system permease protein